MRLLRVLPKTMPPLSLLLPLPLLPPLLQEQWQSASGHLRTSLKGEG
jgi:hypothetical protein